MGADMASSRCASLIIGSVALALSACTTPSEPSAATDLSVQFGWLDGKCIAVAEPIADLPRAILVSPDAASGVLVKGAIVALASEEGDCDALLPDRAQVNRASGSSFYVVETAAPVELGIGVIGEAPDASLQFAHCLTSEGVNFTVSDEGSLVWEAYYYLGYDTEPTCSR